MPNVRNYSRSFAGGEISEELFGRIDDVKFQTGAAKMRNFIATPQGPAENRAGFAYVNATKDNRIARLIPFTYSTDQTMVIEVGAGYFRFHTQGATLLNAGVPYEVANPYAVADLFDIHYVQSNDVLTLVHPNYPPAELRRLGSTNWTFTNIAFAPSIAAPTGVSVAASPGYKAQISSISIGNPAVINTVANHTLVLGDGVYVKGLTVTYSGGGQQIFDGFYLVAKVPTDTSGAPIQNELQLVDYDGNILDSTTWASYTAGTIQYGGKVYDINSYYVVTAIDAQGINESVISAEVAALNNLNVTGSYNTISWNTNLTQSVYGVSSDATTHKATITLDAGQSAQFQTNQTVSYSLPNLNLNGVGNAIISIPNDHQIIVAYSGSNSWMTLNEGGGTVIYGTVTGLVAGGASRYRVYKKRNGLYGFIGETTEGFLVDNNIAPDMGITPPNYDTVFSKTDDYPGAVSYFQQRRSFAGTHNQPQNFWLSKSGTESNFSYSLPTTDSDRIAFRIAAREANTIRHIVPLTQLILLTSSAEIRVSPVNSDAITPTSTDARPQSYVGASNVQPSIVNNALVYCAARGGHVRELGYNWQANGFITGDLSLRAAHLFDNLKIVDQCLVKSPRPIVWFVSSNGNLLGLTYIPEEQIGAWHWHDTDGVFESITAVAEGDEDRLYAVIRRTINGDTVRYIERMGSRREVNAVQAASATIIGSSMLIHDGAESQYWTTLYFNTPHPFSVGQEMIFSGVTKAAGLNTGTYPIVAVTATTISLDTRAGVFGWYQTTDTGTATVLSSEAQDVLFVDAGATYNGYPTTTISGLTWLEGKTVSVLADGAITPQQTVIGGKITLDHAAHVVQVGLPITYDLQTLPLVMQIDGYGQGRQKNINRVWLKVWHSSGIFVGPDADHLTEFKQRSGEPYGTPPEMKSGEIGPIMTTPTWQDSGQIFIRQTYPLPITILGLTLEVALGG